MSNSHAPTYYAKILKFDGTAFTYDLPSGTAVTPSMPLPVASVEFTETLFVPGQSESGSFTLTLHNTKSAEYLYLRPLYNALAFEQQVEIYANSALKGKPVFKGIITEFADELGSRMVRGEDIRRRLVNENLGRYEVLSDTGDDLIRRLLKTYEYSFKDDFNRAAIGADWSADSGTWAIIDDTVLQATAHVMVNAALRRAGDLAASFWDKARVSVDWKPGNLTTSGMDIEFAATAGPTPYTISVNQQTAYTRIELTISGSSVLLRDIPILEQTFNHIDVYHTVEAGGRRITVCVNDLEALQYLDTSGVSSTGHTILSSAVVMGALTGDQWDNYIECSLNDALAAGAIDATTTNVEHEANGENQLAALEAICEQLGWDYRVNFEAGDGNDTLDAGADLGEDWSNDIVLEDEKNIERLQMSRAVADLQTWARVIGQAQDEIRTSAVVTDLAAMSTYGIVMGQDFTDPRIVDAATARTLGLSRLAQTSSGAISISGRIKDEWELYAQNPLWGGAVWGDAIWGGRGRLQVGDYVWLKWPDRAVDRKVRIVSVTRRSGDIGLDLVFDWFAWDYKREVERANKILLRQIRAWMDRNNSPHLTFSAGVGGGTCTVYFSLVGGIITSVRLDAAVQSGGGNVTAISIDGIDYSTALGCPQAAGFTLDLTAYLKYSGAHYIGMTFAAAKVLDVDLHTRILA